MANQNSGSRLRWLRNCSVALLLLSRLQSVAVWSQDPTVSPWGEYRVPGEKLEQFEVRAQLVESSAYMQVSAARSQYNVTGNGLTVAVLDTGLRTTHLDFQGKVLAQRNFSTDDGGNANIVTDLNGHGTNVAGIVCADWYHTGFAPGANVVPLKVLTNSGSGTFSWTVNALDWVIANASTYNITVVNMSLGDGTNLTVEPGGDPNGVRSRIVTLANMRIPVVVAAGNSFYSWSSQEGMGYPGIIRESISVGAIYDADLGPVAYGSGAIAFTTSAPRITPFSQRLHPSTNANTATDIFCTGAALTSSGIISDSSSSTMHGTSQASPCVAGLILLGQEYYLREMGELPTVAQLEGWLKASPYTNFDGDDEDDNVTNTGKSYVEADALEFLARIEDDIVVVPPPVCALAQTSQVRSLLRSLNLPVPFSQLLSSMRHFRDNVLTATPEGRRFAEAYYDHGRELLSGLLHDPRLMGEALAYLVELQPAFAALETRGTAQLTVAQWQRGMQFLERLQKFASPELRSELVALRDFLNDHQTQHGQFQLLKLSEPGVVLSQQTVPESGNSRWAMLGISVCLLGGSSWIFRRRAMA